MKIKPFNTLILVEKLDQEKSRGGIMLPETQSNNFTRLKVLEVGDAVEKVKPNTVVIAHDLVEYIDLSRNIGFITESHVFGEIEDES